MSEELELEGKFKTAKELGLTEPQYCGLVQTLAWLEAGKLDHENEKTAGFDMKHWGAHPEARKRGRCGSVCCIGGTAEVLSGHAMSDPLDGMNGELRLLFYPYHTPPAWKASTAQAAVALRGYLETGKTDWDAAMKTPKWPKRRK